MHKCGLVKRARGANAPGPETIKGHGNPVFHTVSLEITRYDSAGYIYSSFSPVPCRKKCVVQCDENRKGAIFCYTTFFHI